MNPLRQIIEEEIREHGPIPFSRYMELCLYHAQHGYYSRHAEQFGKAGDFYTSSDVHAVFGRLLARQFEEMWRVLGSPERIELIELGPGRGLFAQDVLDWSAKKFPDFFRALTYVLVERSPALRERIALNLHTHIESGKARLLEISKQETGKEAPSVVPTGVDWLAQRLSAASEPPVDKLALDPDVPRIIFANEFFDALPVEILNSQGSLRIAVKDGRFYETWSRTSAEEREFLDRFSVHPETGERLEVPLAAQRQMQQIAMSISRGFLIAIDYGYTRDEQLAGRHRGTLKAIREHSISANPYEAPGEQDLTADVNFTALASAAEGQSLSAHKLVTQSQFLMGIGEANQFADAFDDCRVPQERAKVALQLKHLVTPAGMGESFHVLVASKALDGDRVSALSGLSFGKKER